MARVTAFYSIKESDGNAYHVCSNCVSGQNIKPENKRTGTGGLARCGVCDYLIDNDRC